jgi:hypothetical protein
MLEAHTTWHHHIGICSGIIGIANMTPLTLLPWNHDAVVAVLASVGGMHHVCCQLSKERIEED